MIKLKRLILEDADGNAGASIGMGDVVSAQPGQFAGQTGTIGSGDIGVSLFTSPVKSNKKSKKRINKIKLDNEYKPSTVMSYDDYIKTLNNL